MMHSPVTGKRGAVYLLAIVTLLVGMILSLAMLRMGSAYFLAASSRGKKQAAVNLAKAGLEYAYWQVNNYHVALPYTTTLNLDTGSAQITAVDDNLTVPGGMLVTSTGNSGGFSYTTTRVMTAPANKLPYSYLWCQNSNISSPANLKTLGTAFGVRSNGNISLSNASTNASNGAWATGAITATGSVSPQYPNALSLNLLPVSASHYSSIATEVRASGTTINNLNYAGMSPVIYVTGPCTIDATVAGKYSGVITVFAEGEVTVMGSLQPHSSDSHIAVLSATGIVLQTAGASSQCVFYACNGGTGYINIPANMTVTGCIIADGTSTVNITLNLVTDTSLDTPTLQALHLPGV